jgi:hypothetical protein
MKIFSLILGGVLVAMILLALLNKKIKSKWFCTALGWHWTPRKGLSDGCSMHDTCERCGASIMQDSQGNWF